MHRVHTSTGYSYDPRVNQGSGHCQECGATADELTENLTRLGRGHVSRSYCADHGGVERARRELGEDDLLQAPRVVGDRDAVMIAGSLGFVGGDRQIALLEENGVWLAFCGHGGVLKPVDNPAGYERSRDGNIRTRVRKRDGKRVPRGGKSFPTRDDALAAALAAWRRGITRRVAEIIYARGGTLAWGRPLDDLREPTICDVEKGEWETSWFAAARTLGVGGRDE